MLFFSCIVVFFSLTKYSSDEVTTVSDCNNRVSSAALVARAQFCPAVPHAKDAGSLDRRRLVQEPKPHMEKKKCRRGRGAGEIEKWLVCILLSMVEVYTSN